LFFCIFISKKGITGLTSFWEKDRDRLFEMNVEAVRTVVALSLKYGIQKLV
jgi:hypothetical protein